MTRRLNLGCGSDIRDGWINIDAEPLRGEVYWNAGTRYIQRDVLRGLPFDDESVDEVFSENFLEHIPQTECIWMTNEIWRVCKRGAVAVHLVPLAGSTNFNQDPTHLSHWNEETFTYFQEGHRRNAYYQRTRSECRPWQIEIEPPNVNAVIRVTMVKP